jgi:hypothetical protein
MGNKPWYLEECSATLATAYSSGQGGNVDHEIVSYLFFRFLNYLQF